MFLRIVVLAVKGLHDEPFEIMASLFFNSIMLLFSIGTKVPLTSPQVAST